MSSILKKIAYGSRDYFLGLDYLVKNHPDNIHLLSCYEGLSFRNLAQCIMFDKNGGVRKLNRYLRRPQRFILVSSSGEITGVMVTASMPEFYREIEYEDYAIIGTDTMSGYDKCLKSLSFAGRAEIVAFNAQQVQLVESQSCVKKIHHWLVFTGQRRKLVGTRPNIRLMNGGDFDTTMRLSRGLPEESSLFRALKFQLKGLPYKNYVLSFNDNRLVFAGVYPCSKGFYQLNYLVGDPADNETLSLALIAIRNLVESLGCRLIWRLREGNATQNKVAIARSGFVKLIEEYHLHLKQQKERKKAYERKHSAT